jgi:cyclophilin family peptidyl-prolyl cis-trans isomerase
MEAPSVATASSSTPTATPHMLEAEITDKIYMDVRVSRQDGSFYVRDDLPDTFENRVLKTRLIFGLYGKTAPKTVQNFLSYVVDLNDPKDDVDNPLPSYSRSTFTTLDQSSGLLVGGNIPSLRVVEIGGSTAIRYGERVFSANLSIDNAQNSLSHSTKGLLTHRKLDVTPSFGITTRACPSLDATHTVFGRLLLDDETAYFLNMLQDLPAYQMERPYEDATVVASTVFNTQREMFRGVAKTLGDTRVNKVYEGKLLRRMEVTRVGRL